jgi:prephenate dehydrogenase
MIFGINGYGRFGQLWAEALKSFGEVRVYDPNPSRFSGTSVTPATLEQVAQADVLFLTMPISAFEAACSEITPHLNPKAIVMDCCSVKIHPAEVMSRLFPQKQAIIATHPLFGPDSVKRTGGLQGHRIVVCPVHCTPDHKQQVMTLFVQMGLSPIESTPDEHDKQMARSQGLIHFIGRGLEALQLQPQMLSTPDFQALLNINAMVVNDAWQLFLDMHRYNPFTREIRRNLLQQLTALDRSIGGNDEKPSA